MTSVLNVNNVSKEIYTKNNVKKILSNCNLDIQQGEIFGLIGLNGAGKTTMIKIILDLIKADNGNIKIFDVDSKTFVSRKNICYLPEKFMPSPFLTGYEFLDLSLSFYDKKIDKSQIDRFAKQLELETNVLSRIIKKYSKGMCQKLGLLYCFMSKAPMLILDEPMSGLDPKARAILKQMLIQYSQNGGTIFFSSHILNDIDDICNKVAVLHNCNIKFSGTPQELKEKYNAKNTEEAFLNCIK